MARAKKDSEARSFRLSPEILERLDNYSEETSIPKTAVVEKSLKMYLDANEQDNSEEKKRDRRSEEYVSCVDCKNSA